MHEAVLRWNHVNKQNPAKKPALQPVPLEDLPPGTKIIITRYKNRKSYAKIINRYVNFKEIQAFLQKGHSVEFRDVSGHNLSVSGFKSIMKQIIDDVDLDIEEAQNILSGAAPFWFKEKAQD